MDRVILIQGVEQAAYDRLLLWAKRFDLAAKCLRFASAGEATAWLLQSGSTVDLAFMDAGSLLDATGRSFWTGNEGGAIPLVVLADASQRQALEVSRQPPAFPSLAVGLPSQTDQVAQALGGQKLLSSAVGIWAPHGKGPAGLPAYLAPLGLRLGRRTTQLEELTRADTERLGLLVAEFSLAGPRAPLEWQDWCRQVASSPIPALAALGLPFVGSLREFGALAALVPADRVWDQAAPPSRWAAAGDDLWRDMERSKTVRNFLREADFFLKRSVAPHALAILDHAVSLHPSCASLWAKLSEVHSALGQSDRARDSLRRALGLEPGNRPRWTKLAEALSSAGDQVALVTLLRQATSRFPWDFALRQHFAEAFLKRGDRTAAGIEFSRARLLGPN